MNISRVFRLRSILGQTKIRNRGFQVCCAIQKSFNSPPIQMEKPQLKFVSTYEVKSVQKQDGLLKRILLKVPFLNVHQMRLKAAGFVLYEEIADQVNYISFFKTFELPDTFYSWFVVTELHIWMLSVRLMADAEDGIIVRNALIEALWRDVGQRVKKLETGNPSAVRQDIEELSEQLQAAMIAYDEGLQSDDTVLAGALWRRFYQMGPVHLDHLEKLVKYVRKQIASLDIVPNDQILRDKKVIWEPVR